MSKMLWRQRSRTSCGMSTVVSWKQPTVMWYPWSHDPGPRQELQTVLLVQLLGQQLWQQLPVRRVTLSVVTVMVPVLKKVNFIMTFGVEKLAQFIMTVNMYKPDLFTPASSHQQSNSMLSVVFFICSQIFRSHSNFHAS